jgi:hypothetical protein
MATYLYSRGDLTQILLTGQEATSGAFGGILVVFGTAT